MQQMKIRYSSFFEVERVQSAAVVQFEVRTILDTPAVQEVAEDLYALVDLHGLTELVMDMTGVRFLSSQALGTLVNLQRKAKAAGGQLILTGIDERIGRMFRITRLDSLFAFHADVEEAINTLSASQQAHPQAVACPRPLLWN